MYINYHGTVVSFTFQCLQKILLVVCVCMRLLFHVVYCSLYVVAVVAFFRCIRIPFGCSHDWTILHDQLLPRTSKALKKALNKVAILFRTFFHNIYQGNLCTQASATLDFWDFFWKINFWFFFSKFLSKIKFYFLYFSISRIIFK